MSSYSQLKVHKELFVSENDTLPYNLLVPVSYSNECDSIKSDAKGEILYPLVLFMHGAGERGNDNNIQITHVKKLFASYSNQIKYPCFVVAPQCPKGERWVEVNWSAKSHSTPEQASWAMQKTLQLIDSLVKKYPIDTRRLYVTGLSMGGYGTWDIITRYPNKFAAAIPICGGGDENMADKIKHIPIWAFHGAIDNVVPVERTRNMIKAIKQAGGKPIYTEYKGVKHGSWIKAYKERQLLQWLFDQELIDN